MNKNELKNHMNNILKKAMTESKSGVLPKVDNAGFNIYNETWATVISTDIRDFKELISKYYRWASIKLMQAFTSTIIKISKENNNFVSAYVNGDEVISCFSADTQKKIDENVDTAIKINSAINILFPKVLISNKYNKPFKAGIGVWTSNDNSLVKYGEKGSNNESFSTLVGKAINFAPFIGKFANKNGDKAIIINNLTYNNIGSVNKGYFSAKQKNVYGITQWVYESGVYYSEYKEGE